MERHYRRIQGKTLRAIREEAALRPRCRRDGYLLDQTGRCWFCGRKARRRS